MTKKLSRKSFYFLRHGQTDYNIGKITAGSEDIPLNEHGCKQAISLSMPLAQLPVQRICYSPLKRAKQTMELGADKLDVERIEIDNLRECQGHLWYTMLREKERGSFCEEVETFFSRVAKGVQKVLSFPETALIVAHGGIHWALCRQMGIVDYKWNIGNGEVAHFYPKGEESWGAEIIIRPFEALQKPL